MQERDPRLPRLPRDLDERLPPIYTAPLPSESRSGLPSRSVSTLPSSVDADDEIGQTLRALDDTRRAGRIEQLRQMPADSAERRRLSRQLGIEPSELEDVAEAERAVLAQKLARLAESNPAIARLIDDDPATGMVASRDADKLSTADKLISGIGEFLSKAPGRVGAGATSSSAGIWELLDGISRAGDYVQLPFSYVSHGIVSALGLPGGDEGPMERLERREEERAARNAGLRAKGERIRENNRSDNFIVESALSGLEYAPISIAATLTRNPRLAAGIPSGTVAAEGFREARDQGVSFNRAALYGLLQGGSEYATEILPASKLVNAIINKSPFGKTLVKTLAAEIPGEQMATLIQDMGAWAYLPENRNKTLSDFMGERGEAALGTLIGTVSGTTAQVGFTRGVGRAAEIAMNLGQKFRSARQAKTEGKFIEEVTEQFGGMEARTADPAAFAKLVREMGEERGISMVLVDGEAARAYMQGEDFEGESDPLFKYAKDIEDAAMAGGDVALPFEFVAGTLPGTKALKTLLPDMRLTAGGETPREAQAFLDSAEEIEAELNETIGARQQGEADDTAATEKAVSRVQEKLEEAGYTPYAAEQQARTLVSRMKTREARRNADDPEGAVASAIENFRIVQRMPEELRRAMEAEEGDMVLAAVRGKEQGSTSRARAAAKELVEELDRRGYKPADLSDDQIREVIARLQDAGETDGREYTAGNRGERDGAGGQAPLAGAPKVSVGGVELHGPIPRIVEAAEAYAEAAGIPFTRQAEYVPLDEDLANRLADAYEAMEHNPGDPAVAEAYAAMIEQTRAQYDALVDAGVKFTFFDNESDPYEGKPWRAMLDLRENNSLAVYSTAAGFGSDETVDVSDNPLLADTGLTWPDQNGVEQPVLANDLFRAVHDAFGHGIEGAGFRAQGEENAWQAHSRLFTGPALAALTSETRGQNSWLNYGPHGDKNRDALLDDTTFGDQKTGLLPEWAWTENVAPAMEPTDGRLEQLVADGEVAVATAAGPAIGWTEGRIDALLENFGDPENEGQTEAFAARLSPNQFLGLTLSGKGRDRVAERVEGEDYGGEIDFDRLRENTQPIFLVVSREGGKIGVDTTIPHTMRVMGHEGRHRMTMLKKAGIESVPVVIILRDKNQPPTEGITEFGPQRSRSSPMETGDTPTDVEGLEPISYANRERLKEVFGYGRELFQEELPDTIEIDGQQRSTTNSEGQPLARTEEGVRNFWRWFGDSKVVDADGKPLVVYHGTSGEIDAFNGMAWVAQDIALANEYAEMRSAQRDQPANVMAVYARTERVFNADYLPKTVTVGSFFNEALEQAEAAGQDIDIERARALLDLIREAATREESGPHYDRHNFWNNAASLFGQDGAEAIKEMFALLGFDGVLMRESAFYGKKGDPTFGVFEPNQIKSVENSGQFDPADPRILYQPAERADDLAPIMEMADEADDALTGDAARAIGDFVGMGPRAKEKGVEFGLMNARPLEEAYSAEGDPAIRQQIEEAFAPIRERLRMMFGDRITLYRRQNPVIEGDGSTTNMSAGADGSRNVLSWTADPSVANWFANAERDAPAPYTEEEIAAAEAEFAENGEVSIGKNTRLVLTKEKVPAKTKSGEPVSFSTEFEDIAEWKTIEYTMIYRGQEAITDTESVRAYMERTNRDRQEDAAKIAERRTRVVEMQVPVEQIVWITDRAGQQEFIVRNSEGRSPFIDRGGRVLYQPAYHGSPHLFDRFSLDKIGTGEGAQAYGWGLYFANKKEIAEYYRDTLARSGDVYALDGEQIKTLEDWVRQEQALRQSDPLMAQLFSEINKWSGDKENRFRQMRDWYRDNTAMTDALDRLEGRLSVQPAKGRLYEVDIPEDNEYLLWDAPLSEQPENIQQALRDAGFGEELDEKGAKYPLTGGDIYNRLMRKLGLSENALSFQRGDYPKMASLTLLRHGIAGIKYLDGGSRSKGDGSFNYVVFDDSRIAIRSYEQATLFYSALERAIENTQTPRAPAQQWINTLKKTPGVKQEELDNTGVLDWLEMQDGPVEKEQLLKLVRDGGIVIREVVLTGKRGRTAEEVYDEFSEDIYARTSELADEEFDEEFESEIVEHEIEDEADRETIDAFDPEVGPPYQAPRAKAFEAQIDLRWTTMPGEKEFDRAYGDTPESLTKIKRTDDEDAEHAYTLGRFASQEEAEAAIKEVKEDLRSWLIEHQDYEQPHRETAEQEFLDQYLGEGDVESTAKWQEYSWSNESNDEDEAEGYFELLMNLPPGEGGNPKKAFSGHWSDVEGAEGNIIHIRAFPKRGEDGKKILFLDEEQSDVHKAAADAFMDAKKYAVRPILDSFIASLDPDAEDTDAIVAKIEKARDRGKEGALWSLVEKWARDNAGRPDVAEALKAVDDANEGYAKAPSPEKAAEAEKAWLAAGEAHVARSAEVSALVVETATKVLPEERAKAVAAYVADGFGQAERELYKQLGDVESELWDKRQAAMGDGELALEYYRNAAAYVMMKQELLGSTSTQDDARLAIALRDASIHTGRSEEEIASEVSEEALSKLKSLLDAKRAMDAARELRDLRGREYDIARGALSNGGVPDTPFKKTWMVLAMKRVILWAAAEGYDQVAWIKKGEANAGKTGDDFDWLYGKVLPNETQKLIKKYGGKVRPIYAAGMSPMPHPRLEKVGEEFLELAEFPLPNPASKTSLDQALERARTSYEKSIENNQQGIDRDTETLKALDAEIAKNGEPRSGESRGSIVGRIERMKGMVEERKEDLANLDKHEDRLRELHAEARELAVPGLDALDEKIAQTKERKEEAWTKAGIMQDRALINRKDEGREHYDEVIERARTRIETERKNIKFHRNVITAVEKAIANGEATAEVEGLDLPVAATEATIESHGKQIERNKEQMAQFKGLLERQLPFEEAYEASIEYQKARGEQDQLEIERKRMAAYRPTNFGFDITPELREAAASGFPLFQPDHRNAGPRGRILFPGDNAEGAVIELFQSRNLSTLIHESGHLYLEELKQDASAEGASEQLKRDYQIVLDWFRDNGHEVRDGIIPVGAHELFARGYERYVREGKAPSLGLQRAFETFRSWLVDIYKMVTSLNAPITPEIRGVFDRLLATDAEIEMARASQGLTALFDDLAKSGMTKGEFANYQEQVQNARAEATGKMLERTMADIRKRETALYRNRARDMKEQVATEVENSPLFRALSIMRRERVDKQWIVENFGQEVLAGLPTRVPPIYAENGNDPQVIAEKAGYETASQMIEALVIAQAEQDAAEEGGDERNLKTRTIEQRTERRMDAEFGDPMTDEEIEREAIAAVNSEQQGEVLAAEIRALSRRNGKRPTPYRVAREWARTRVRQGTYADEASPSAIYRHRRAIERASKEAELAFAQGDTEAALRAKQKQMLSSALMAEAKQAGDEVERARKRMAKIAAKRTIASVDQDYLEQAHALLEAVDLKERTQISLDRKGKWEQWATEREAEGKEVIAPKSFEAMISGTNWSRLPVEQLLGLDEAVKQVIHFGRMKQRLLDNKDARDFAEVKERVRQQAEKVGKKEPKSDFDVETWRDQLKSKVLSADANLLKVETIFDMLDDGDPEGVFNTFVFQPISRAQDRERDMLRDFYDRMKANFEEIGDKTLQAWTDKIDTGMIEPKTGKPWTPTREQVVAMALNWGNAGNRQRLADGYGFRQEAIERLLMDTLTEQEWQFVQRTWNIIGELWPEIAALERRVNGVEPEKVEATEVVTPYGTLEGGYYPAIYNTKIDRKARQHLAESEDLFSAMTTKATTRASSTKERSEEVKRPILLDLGVINRHMGEVIHDITHREAILQADRLLSDPEVLDQVDAVLGREYSEQFRPWLKFIANRWAHDRAGNEAFGSFFSRLRANTTVVGMGLRFTTMMTQLAGYSNSIEYVGEAAFAKALAQTSAHPIDTARFVFEKSGEMRHRVDTIDRDINRALRDMQQPKFKRKGKRVLTSAQEFAFHGIGYMDRVVSVPTWLAGYNNALERGASEEQAIYEGDKAVRLSQGAADAKDLAAIQRGTGSYGEILKWLTMFYSYMSAFYQRQRRLGRDIRRMESAAEIPGLIARAWWLLVVPPILAELLSMRWPDDDEDLGLWMAKKMIGQSLGPIPLVRDAWEPAWAGFNKEPSFGYRMSPAAGFGTSVVNVSRDAGNIVRGEPTKRATRNTMELVGYSTGLIPGQVAQSTQFWVDVGYGEQNPRDAWEMLEGTIKGKVEE